MVIRRIDPLSCAKVSGLLYALMGLVFGAFFSLAMLTIRMGGVAPEEARPMGALFGVLFGAGAIVAAPLFYGAMGFIGGGIAAFAYNIIAGWTGGLEMDVQ